MDFAAFARRADEIEAADADAEIESLTSDLLATAGADLPIVARFVQGRVFPAWQSRTLDVGPSYCYEAIARAAGPNVTADDVEGRLAEAGDVGEVAASYDLGGQRGLGSFGDGGGGDDLTVAGVYDELSGLAAEEGEGSRDRKIDRLFGLFNRATSAEARYLARLVLSEMRIGVGEGTVRDAVADAFDVPVETVERALQVTNDYGRVAAVARDDGADGLDELSLTLGRPVQAMLAQAGTVGDALEEWDRVAVETKYDGARVQVHYAEGGLDADAAVDPGAHTGREASGTDGQSGSATVGTTADRRVGIYSRNMEDVTDALPEIVEAVEASVEPPAIVDGEVVAVDEDGDPLPFQQVLRRFRRKHDVERAREDVALELHAFDCLHAGGDDLLDVPLTERRDRLGAVAGDLATGITYADDADEVEAVEADALAAGHEGVMLKNPDAAYTPGSRGRDWLKRKPDVETLDLAVTGAEWGEGRRANFLGTFVLSVRAPGADGPDDGRADDPTVAPAGFETIGKVATGITEETLADLTELIEPHVVAQDGQTVAVEPAVVFEVGYEEIQSSPTYSSDYALRFPRFVGVREDKAPDDADSLERVQRLANGTDS